MGRIITFANHKGGVAKTTGTINAGAALSRSGRRVLLVDFDPQASLTSSLGLKGQDVSPTIYEVLKGKASIEKAILRHSTAGGQYDFVPSGIMLEAAEGDFATTPGREFMLKEALEGLEGLYDYILIDAPPRLTWLIDNVFTAANEVFVPLQAHYLALNGISLLIDKLALIKRRINPGINITGVFATFYDSRRGLNREVMADIRAYFGPRVFETMIRDNIALAEAPSYGQDIFEYGPRSNGAQDYTALSLEIMAQEGRQSE